MSFKKHIIFAILVISSLFFVFAFADLVSEGEGAEKSAEAISMKDVFLSGDRAAESYDQHLLADFVSKQKWSDMQKSLQLLFGKRQIDSVSGRTDICLRYTFLKLFRSSWRRKS